VIDELGTENLIM